MTQHVLLGLELPFSVLNESPRQKVAILCVLMGSCMRSRHFHESILSHFKFGPFWWVTSHQVVDFMD